MKTVVREEKMKTYRNFTYITALLATLLTTGACGASSTSVAKDALAQKQDLPVQKNQQFLAAKSSDSPSDAQLLKNEFSDGQQSDSTVTNSVALVGALAIAVPNSGQSAAISASAARTVAQGITPSITGDPGQITRLALYSQAAPGTAIISGQSTVQTLCWVIFSPALQLARRGGVDVTGKTQPQSSGQGDYLSVVDATTGQSFGTYAFSA